MFSLWNIVGHECEQITIIDVGAMRVGTDACSYHALLRPGVCKVIGFEPNKEECLKLNEEYQKLNQSNSANCLFLPYVIGDGSERIFNLCNYNMTSSLYEPNMILLEKFQNLSELCQVVERTTVSTKRLDDIDEVRGADYLKIDVQGAEVDVFNGAKNLLADIVIIHAEVEFVPLYINQPLFAEVDQNLRSNGFLFHKFYGPGLAGRTFKPLVFNDNINRPLSQILWADAIYIRNFLNYDQMPPEKLLKLAVILHDVYGSYDLVHYILQHYDKQQHYDKHTPSKWAEQYIHLLRNDKSLVQIGK